MMKPEQLNRLIRVNSRMQPWFLRNTSELYESAVRSYYKRGPSSVMPRSTHNRHTRSIRLEENVGSLRKVKTAATESSAFDGYPRNHRLQADHAASITSGHLLHKVMQARRRRSTFSVGGAEMNSPSSNAHQYSVFGQSALGDSSSSCSEPSQDGILMEKLPRCLRRTRATATARRERKRMGRRSCREIDVGKGHQLGMDMGLIGARSLNLPPLSGLGMGNSYMRQMPPSRQHHMKAIEKTTLANAALIPREEGDSLITVDEALRRRISVIDHAVKRPTSAELGHLMTGGNASRSASGSLGGAGRLPSKMCFRFHTLGDRVKQFEYIQFADGPVTSYAFNRRQQSGAQHRVHEGGSTSSSFSRTDTSIQNATSLGQKEQQTKPPHRPRPLSFHNILHANHRQRSRSLEAPRGSLGPLPLPLPLPTVAQVHAPPHGPLGIARNTRGSRIYSSSRTSISACRNTVGKRSATSASNFGVSKPTMAHNTKGTSAMKLTPYRGLTPGGKSLRTESTQFKVTCQPYSRTAQESLLPIKIETIPVSTSAAISKPMTREFRKSTVTRKLSSNSGDSTWGTLMDNNSRGSSTAKLDSRPSSIDALFKKASKNNLETASGAFFEKSKSDIAHHEPARVTCAPVQLQQRSLQVDSPDEEISLCLTKVKSKIKPKKEPLEKIKAEPRVPNVTSNQVSRSCHRAFFQAPHDYQSAGSPPNKVQRKKQALLEKAEKSPEQWKKNLDKQKREHGSKGIAVPSSQPEKQSAHLNGTNHLLAASASQVSAYKRAFRTQQQMLKAEILHHQAQHLQKREPKPKPSPSSESSSHSNQQPQEGNVRPIQLSRLQSRRGSIPTTSRESIRPVVKCTAANQTGRNGAFLTKERAKPTVGRERKGAKGSTASAVKAVAAPVTAPLTVAGTRTTTMSTAEPALRQKRRPVSAALASATTSAKGAVAGAATAASAAAKSKTKVEGGEARRRGVRRGAEEATKKRRVALTQQQHSRNDNGSGNGSSLLGFYRETGSRAASSLLQRRDESEQTSQSQLPSQLKAARRKQQSQQQQPQRRRFHFEYPPWRPSY